MIGVRMASVVSGMIEFVYCLSLEAFTNHSASYPHFVWPAVHHVMMQKDAVYAAVGLFYTGKYGHNRTAL